MKSPPDAHPDASAESGDRLRVRDFMRRDGVGVDSQDDRLTPEDTLIRGQFLHKELRRGLFVHGSDVVEERPFTVTSHLRAGLSCIFFLDGQVDLELGDRRFEFRSDVDAIRGAAIMSVDAESFRRASCGRQHVRHLVVSATPEWLDADGLEDVRDGGLATRLLKDHLTDHRWTLTPRVAELVRQVVTPSAFMPELRNLYLEGRAVEIVAETIAAVTRTDRRSTHGPALSRHDMMRLRRARDVIAARLTEPLSVDAIARESGASASGLQRLFRLAEGRSVFEYVRQLRLDRSLAALRTGECSVQEASAIAGYSNAANFATAFRRQFGITPRDALNRQ
ncbi:AraC family transcriptional regulator [Aquamicrobium sp. LC103]|uniref:helix-turn-helix transcriptional regulator n=1 Tax=Aquamicrobium sp. LC103 TaxID=1120658 RepID=UPI00063E7951|nr:AraC family transcriptional regulator [Aquamicrobium sp. LC103]TKT74173.1 helix-turn-helix transcriptional regulator [Aquamicrobium sp. LC103]